MSNERFIVAEVSKNWIDGEEVVANGPIALLFETIVTHNDQRGYRLLTFSLHRLMTGPREINETIIAVFERISLGATRQGTTETP